MISFLKFLIYKLYRMAINEKESVYPTIGFLTYLSIFEILHFAIIMGFLDFNFGQINKSTFCILFIIIGYGLNYSIFIQSKMIYRIDEYFLEKNINKTKGNLIFIGYLSFLLMCILLQTYLHENK